MKKAKQYISDIPELLKEWDFERNKGLFSPNEITIGSSRNKINWICATCGYRWPATAYNRVHLDSGCPQCGNLEIARKARERRFNPRNSLLVRFPEIAAEWHPTKNDSLDIEKVMSGSNDIVWWICQTCGTEYLAQVINRTGYKHVGCPTCNKYMHTSFPEQALFYYLKMIYPLAINKDTSVLETQTELDIYLPEITTGIEYDGNYWHQKSSITRAKQKYLSCQQHRIRLIRIKENYKRYEMCDADCDDTIYRESATDEGLAHAIRSVCRLLLVDTIPDINIERDRAVIKSNYIVSFKEKSLLARYPVLCTEWHPTLNDKLRPNMIMPSCHDKVWWLCPKCNQAYDASPAHRTRSTPSGCPICAGKRIVAGINDLATKRPDLAADWHPTKNNDLRPTQVAPNYSKKVWWQCRICGDEFYCTPNKRVTRNQGCKQCKRLANTTNNA